jgi:hypothetical protein
MIIFLQASFARNVGDYLRDNFMFLILFLDQKKDMIINKDNWLLRQLLIQYERVFMLHS